MQEGMAALIQMPSTAAAADELAQSGLLSAIVYRSPTTGGVYASPAAPSSARQAIRQARSRSRPSGLEWASVLCSSWVELRGEDPAIRAGLARIGGERVIVVAMDRYADGAGAARPGPAACSCCPVRSSP